MDLYLVKKPTSEAGDIRHKLQSHGSPAQKKYELKRKKNEGDLKIMSYSGIAAFKFISKLTPYPCLFVRCVC
jgi:hypothetical protein